MSISSGNGGLRGRRFLNGDRNDESPFLCRFPTLVRPFLAGQRAFRSRFLERGKHWTFIIFTSNRSIGTNLKIARIVASIVLDYHALFFFTFYATWTQADLYKDAEIKTKAVYSGKSVFCGSDRSEASPNFR